MTMTTMTTIDVQAAFLQRPHSQSDTIRVLPMVRYAVFCGRPIGRREQELVFVIGIKEGLWNF